MVSNKAWKWILSNKAWGKYATVFMSATLGGYNAATRRYDLQHFIQECGITLDDSTPNIPHKLRIADPVFDYPKCMELKLSTGEPQRGAKLIDDVKREVRRVDPRKAVLILRKLFKMYC